MSVRTAFSIIQEFRKGILLDAPTALFGSTDPDEMQMQEHLNQVLEYLRKRGPWRGQVRTYDFTTSQDVTVYSLPGDYWEAMPGTLYNEDTQCRLIGPLPDAEFVEYQERGLAAPREYVWRIAGYGATATSVEGRAFEIYPAPGADENLTFEYLSGNLYLPADWFASQDRDLHERLAADTDYCAFDADLVKLGLLWKYRNSTSNDRAAVREAKDEFDREIASSRFRLQGARQGSFGPRRRRRWYAVPDGNWSFS